MKKWGPETAVSTLSADTLLSNIYLVDKMISPVLTSQLGCHQKQGADSHDPSAHGIISAAEGIVGTAVSGLGDGAWL